jgi:hypothetical protein
MKNAQHAIQWTCISKGAAAPPWTGKSNKEIIGPSPMLSAFKKTFQATSKRGGGGAGDRKWSGQKGRTSYAPHLKAIPGVGTLSARGLAGSDVKHLGGQTHWPLHLQVLLLGTPDQVSAHCTPQRVRQKPTAYNFCQVHC